jgi:N-acyl homoserine lactone hydrolase
MTSIVRLNLGTINVIEEPWPVHGFVVLHERLGAVLVDTGCGAPDQLLKDYRVVNRKIAEALADHDLAPADIKMVINSHLHFDHCGQNAVFPHAPVYVQRKELERSRRESPWQREWLEYAGARFELLDGDTELAEGLRIISTPGHTVGHQCVVVETNSKEPPDLLIGDAAFTVPVYRRPDRRDLPPGQHSNRAAWQRSLGRIRDLKPSRIHFCHDSNVLSAPHG